MFWMLSGWADFLARGAAAVVCGAGAVPRLPAAPAACCCLRPCAGASPGPASLAVSCVVVATPRVVEAVAPASPVAVVSLVLSGGSVVGPLAVAAVVSTSPLLPILKETLQFSKRDPKETRFFHNKRPKRDL